MNIPRTLEELHRLVANKIPESIHLDYKQSESLIESKNHADVSKDVSAFANSDGGVLVYGVVEEKHVPVQVDAGVPTSAMNRERLENLITSNISPRVDGLEIYPLEASAEHFYYVVHVPKGYRGAHQDRKSHRYYKRFNFKSEPMEDYEIADVRSRRKLMPALVNVDLEIRNGFWVDLVVTNIGDAMAQDVRFSLSPDVPELTAKMAPNFVTRGIRYLPAGKSYRMSCGSALEAVNEHTGFPSVFDVEVTYFDPRLDRQTSNVFHLDAMNYLNTPVIHTDAHELADKLKDYFGTLTREVSGLKSVLEQIATVAAPTGLQLSSTTLRNLAHLRDGNEPSEKIDPTTCSPHAFREVLGVSMRTSLSLHHHFRYRHHNPRKLEELEWLDPADIPRIKAAFIVEEEDDNDSE
jgi:hypothetical protein